MMARGSPHPNIQCSLVKLPSMWTNFLAFILCAITIVVTPARAEILNTVTATATTPSSGTVAASANESVTVVSAAPTLTVTKSATVNDGGDGVADPGDTVSYVVTVRNTGNVTLFDVLANDPLTTLGAPSLSDDVAPASDSPDVTGGDWDVLAPGDAISYSGTYALAATDVLAGEVSNTASAAATTVTGTPVTGSATLVTPLPGNSSLTLDKTSSLDTGPDGIANAGDIITYQFVVTNTGTTALSNIVVDDPLLMASAADETSMGRVLALLEDATLRTDPITTASFAPDEQRHNPNLWAFEKEDDAKGVRAGVLPPPLPVALHGKRRLVNLTGAAARAGLGDLVGIHVELTNTGDVPITGITVKQSGSEAFGNVLDILLPNETNAASIIFTHEITSLDLGAAALDLPATVRGKARGREVTIRLDDVMSLGDISAREELLTADINPTNVPSLAPGQQTIFSGTYTVTQADVDSGSVSNTATATGTPPSGGNVVATDSEVTLLPPSPAIVLVKTSSLDLGGDGIATPGDNITYTFTVTNAGNVTLLNIGVTDPLVAVSGGPVASLAPGASDSTTFTATYALAQTDIDAANVTNQATAAGTPAGGGAPVSDLSDDGDLLGDDPTVTNITLLPALTLLKTVTSITDTNGNMATDLTDVINYGFIVANTGNVTLHNVTLTDPNATVTGGPIASLAPGATDSTTFNATHTVSALDMIAGSVSNQATVTGAAATGEQASDLSHPTDPAGNEPTVVPVVLQPAIALVKTMQAVTVNTHGTPNPADDTLEIAYDFAVTNTGNVTLNNIQVTDPLVAVSGSLNSLAPGASDTASFSAIYIITPADIASGQVVNQATVNGTAPNNAVATDLSDHTDFFNDRPTVVALANQPAVAIVKQFAGYSIGDGDGIPELGEAVLYSFTVSNTGNVPLYNITVTDGNATVSGGPLLSLSVGASDSTTFTASHTLTLADLAALTITNQATVNASSFAGPVSDLSDESSTSGDDPTIVNLTESPAIALIKTVGSVTDANSNGFTDEGDTINYSFTVTNTGNVTLFNIALTDANAIVSGGPIASLTTGNSDSTSFTASHLVTAADFAAGQVVNQATVQGTSGSGTVVSDLSDVNSIASNDPTVTSVLAAPVAFSMAAARSEIRRGETVAYTITATDLGSGPFDVADFMPPGFIYVPGSASVNGIATTPTVSGQTLSFASISPVAGAITIQLSLRASAGLVTGDATNRARLYLNATGELLASANANVAIREDHVFDCGDIIGRVFDDLNGNGIADDGEPGLAAVRIATVRGVLITTDKNGRFHLSCADVPNAEIGSTFLMKLDTRTLPDGYRVTTENPRDVRLTRGKVTKLNFGAHKARSLALTLNRDAFEKNSVKLKSKWAGGIDRLVSLLQQAQGNLTLSYRCTSFAPIAEQRLAHVEELIQARWAETGGAAPLKIATRVECGKE
jgi:uncharacterized repeat protein (TIGR01451 family)